ncbi:MAG: tripartite tricarboxylate transporter substrate binding protein [Betaproteobacteria bacterium]|nr:MAG: tripartite tricarboxylate transporter substrate binding protein [Betaproteobacteria bacterium]
MKRPARSIGRLILSVVFLAAWVSAALSQDYPQKPIRMIVGFPPGGGADLIGRVVADQLSSKLGVTLVVENIAGAGTSIAVATAAKAPNDGYTLLFATSSFAINPNLYKKVNYDPINDFVPIAQVGTSPFAIVVQQSSPLNSVNDLLTTARGQPGALRYSSGGNGSVGHLAGEVFKSMAKVDIQHIPYKGLASALGGLLGGQVELTMSDLASSLGYVRNGRLKILGVTTKDRVSWLPNVPSIAESGVPGYEVVLWNALFLPRGAPKHVVDRLHAAAVSIFKTPDKTLTDRFNALGVIPPPIESQETFAAFVKSELMFWSKVVKQSGAHVD